MPYRPPGIGGPCWNHAISGTKLNQKRNSNEKVLGKLYDRLLLLSCPYGSVSLASFRLHQMSLVPLAFSSVSLSLVEFFFRVLFRLASGVWSLAYTIAY